MATSLREILASGQRQEEHQVEEAMRQVRASLSADAKAPMDLTWCQGQLTRGRKEPLFLHPGKTVVLPIDRAQWHFGPFALIEELKTCTDEKRRAALIYTIETEKTRLLNRWDYERPLSWRKDGYEPIGPHRFPDVTVTILNADGSESDPIRLHELYEIGDFDPLKEKFAKIAEASTKTAESRAEAAEREVEELRRTTAEALGMVKALAGKVA